MFLPRVKHRREIVELYRVPCYEKKAYFYYIKLRYGIECCYERQASARDLLADYYELPL